MLPKISFLARLTRDVESRFTEAGMCVAKVGLACSEKYGEKETQLFIDGTAFKKTGEMISQITKGQRVFVTGKIQTDQWQDSQSGQNRSKITMIIESFEFIEKKQDSQQSQQNNQGFNQQTQNQQQNNQQQGFQQNNTQGFQNQGNQGFNQPPEDD